MSPGNQTPTASTGRDGAADAPAACKAKPAIKCPLAVAMFLILTTTGLGLDLWSKDHVFTELLGQTGLVDRVSQVAPSVPDPQKILPYLNLHRGLFWKIKFTLSTNPGIVFGMSMAPTVVAVASLMTIALVVFFFASGNARAWSMHAALAFILAGAMGNLYDRLFSAVHIPGIDAAIVHQVRDFIDLGDIHLPFAIFGRDNYPWVFNVADMLLVVGVLLLMVNWLVHRKD